VQSLVLTGGNSQTRGLRGMPGENVGLAGDGSWLGRGVDVDHNL
jgi:hypothetical protein